MKPKFPLIDQNIDYYEELLVLNTFTVTFYHKWNWIGWVEKKDGLSKRENKHMDTKSLVLLCGSFPSYSQFSLFMV